MEPTRCMRFIIHTSLPPFLHWSLGLPLLGLRSWLRARHERDHPRMLVLWVDNFHFLAWYSTGRSLPQLGLWLHLFDCRKFYDLCLWCTIHGVAFAVPSRSVRPAPLHDDPVGIIFIGLPSLRVKDVIVPSRLLFLLFLENIRFTVPFRGLSNLQSSKGHQQEWWLQAIVYLSIPIDRETRKIWSLLQGGNSLKKIRVVNKRNWKVHQLVETARAQYHCIGYQLKWSHDIEHPFPTRQVSRDLKHIVWVHGHLLE